MGLGRGRLLEKILSGHETKGYVYYINLRALEQSRRNANVREQEIEIVVSVVLVIVGRGEVTAGATWHGCSRLETENAVCVPGRVVLASRSVVH